MRVEEAQRLEREVMDAARHLNNAIMAADKGGLYVDVIVQQAQRIERDGDLPKVYASATVKPQDIEW
jgi:hypothetical protein